MRLKRAAIFFVLLFAVVWTSCGGSSNNSTSTVSGIKDRALFDNTVNGAVNILNIDVYPAQLFQTTPANLSVPERMLRASDRSFVLIYDDSAFTLSIFNSAQETVTSTLNLNYHTDSFVMSSDNKSAYAAVPNNPEFNAPPGVVLTFDLTTGSSGAQIPIPGARRVSISGDNKKLLAFSDSSDSVYYVDLTASTFKAVTVPGFNRPYAAVFSSDNTTAYVLNAGTENSGSSAPSVQVLTFPSSGAPVAGASLPVGGATIGYLNGSTLYVAGNDLTKPAGSQGTISVVDVSNMTLTSSTQIADGLHDGLAAYSGKLWIGSSGCSTSSCLSIYDTGSKTAKLGSIAGDVTALTPAASSGWMYVMEGGQLYQYDPNSLSVISPYQILGQGWDIKLLDQ